LKERVRGVMTPTRTVRIGDGLLVVFAMLAAGQRALERTAIAQSKSAAIGRSHTRGGMGVRSTRRRR